MADEAVDAEDQDLAHGDRVSGMVESDAGSRDLRGMRGRHWPCSAKRQAAPPSPRHRSRRDYTWRVRPAARVFSGGRCSRAQPAPRRSAPRTARHRRALPSTSSASTASRPPPPQCAISAPSVTASAGASVGRRIAIDDAGAQHARGAAGDRRERAWKRRRDRTHEVVHRCGVAGPVDDAVVGAAAAEIAAFVEILPATGRSAGEERRKRGVERHFRGERDLVEHVACRVVGKDRHGVLRDDVAAVRFLGHVVERRAGDALAMQHRPIDRRAAAILGQQRSVHVERAARRQCEQRRLQHPAIVEREDEIGPQRSDLADDLRVVGVVRRDHRNRMLGRCRRDRCEPDRLARRVLVRDDERHPNAVREQRLEATHADVVIREDDSAGAAGSRALHAQFGLTRRSRWAGGRRRGGPRSRS